MNIIGVCRHGLFGDLFSTGMDKLCAELNKATPLGCHFTVSGGNNPTLDEASFDAGLLAALAKGATIIYAGHSLGADAALRFADLAGSKGYKLPLICPIDPVIWDSNAQTLAPGQWKVGPNVARVVAYHSMTWPGGGSISLAPGNNITDLKDEALSLPHAALPDLPDIAKSSIVHQAIKNAVLDVVRQLSSDGQGLV